jgi:hypothetical protein
MTEEDAEEGEEKGTELAERPQEEEEEERGRPITPDIIKPMDIVVSVFSSLDAQIEALDQIPDDVLGHTTALLNIITDLKQNIFEDPATKIKFINALLGTSEEVGHAFHAILEIERERANPEKTPSNIPPMPQLPQIGQMGTPEIVERPVQGGITLNTQQPQMKIGYWAMRQWRGMVEKWLEAQKDLAQAQITSSKVVDILDYGRELEAEWMRLMNFYHYAQQRLSFFDDKETYRNQHQEVETHIIKMISIIRAFTRTIVEYRKERFGDRKVGVAQGAMALEATEAAALGNLRLSDLIRGAREQMGDEQVGARET